MIESETGAAAFVAHWQRVAPLVDQVRRREQRDLEDDQHAAAIANVLRLAVAGANPSETSGLVEQQRLFQEAQR